MGIIKYVKGDVTKPIGNKGIICHVNNDMNAWGSGVVMAISGRWPITKEMYHKIPENKRKVGFVQLVDVEDNITVANMIGQNGLRYNEYGVPAVNYAAIEVALNKVATKAVSQNRDIHMPRIGCGLSGGSWDIIELIILRVLRNHSCNVYVYDFDGNDNIVAKLN